MRILFYKISLRVRIIFKGLATLYSLRTRSSPGIYFLMYHSVGEGLDLEIDIDKKTFSEQINYIKSIGSFISIEEASKILKVGKKINQKYYVLTFDDGYKNFIKNAEPLINEHNIPALVYLNTGYIENNATLPIDDRIGFKGEIEGMTWRDITSLMSNKLISLGCHCHSHKELEFLSEKEIIDDLENSLAIFHKKVAYRPEHFCYPRGSFNSKVIEIVSRYFSSAVLTTSSNAPTKTIVGNYMINRIPILKSDGLFWFKLRLLGKLYVDVLILKHLSRAIFR